MSENKKWKEKLISSSFPLEYLVSRKLAALDIAVQMNLLTHVTTLGF
jgi:hypothetical protein